MPDAQQRDPHEVDGVRHHRVEVPEVRELHREALIVRDERVRVVPLTHEERALLREVHRIVERRAAHHLRPRRGTMRIPGKGGCPSCLS